MFGLGTTEIALIVLVIVLLFGATKLPQLARSLGESRKAFKDGLKEAEEEGSRSKHIGKGSPVNVASVSDEELMAEMQRRRAQSRP